MNMKPFKMKRTTVGEIPNIYLDSLSYLEQLMSIVKWLQNDVYPALQEAINTINDNTELVENTLNQFQTTINNLLTDIETYKTNLTNEFDTFKNSINTDMTSFETQLTTNFNDFQDTINNSFNLIKEEWEELVNFLNTGNLSSSLQAVPFWYNLFTYNSNTDTYDKNSTPFPAQPIIYYDTKENPNAFSTLDFTDKTFTSYDDEYNGKRMLRTRGNYLECSLNTGFTGDLYFDINTNTITPINHLDGNENYNTCADAFSNNITISDGVLKINYLNIYRVLKEVNNWTIDSSNVSVFVNGGSKIFTYPVIDKYIWFMNILNQMQEIIATGKIDVTADFTPQFNELNQKIIDLTNTVNTDVTNLTESVTALENEVETVTNNLTTFETQVNSEIEVLTNNYCILSITYPKPSESGGIDVPLFYDYALPSGFTSNNSYIADIRVKNNDLSTDNVYFYDSLPLAIMRTISKDANITDISSLKQNLNNVACIATGNTTSSLILNLWGLDATKDAPINLKVVIVKLNGDNPNINA